MKQLILLISIVLLPFTALAQYDFCIGNTDYDRDLDGADLAVIKEHFGRSEFHEPCPPDGPAPVPKTGQTTSYATGDDGDLESGVEHPPLKDKYTNNNDGTIKDNLSGLIWLKNADCFGERTWVQALSDCNDLATGQCGLSDGSNPGDWRLPNLFELESLRNMQYYDPCISDTVGSGHWSENDPFTNIQFSYYWSSTTIATNMYYAWLVTMHSCNNHFFNKDIPNYVWPVRGGH